MVEGIFTEIPVRRNCREKSLPKRVRKIWGPLAEKKYKSEKIGAVRQNLAQNGRKS